jgi:hypothetical protein
VKCLTLWQPWASLIAVGAKRVETRGWSSPYRGLLAIHAAATWNAESRAACVRLSQDHPEAMGQLGVFEPLTGSDPTLDGSRLPRGAVVAVARLVDVRLMDHAWLDEQTDLELDVGGWEPGRYGWVLEDVRAVEPAVPLKGQRGLFDLGGELAARLDRAPGVRAAVVDRLAGGGA